MANAIWSDGVDGIMNWLAHIFLSEPHVEFRLGNLLADLVKRKDRAAMTATFLRGVRRHEAIDAFTDSHAIVRRSRARLGGEYRHTRRILVDVFYDHFLALAWDQYSAEPLEAFTASTYVDIRACPIELPDEAQVAIDWIIREDWLGSYRKIEGIDAALRGVSRRLSARRGKQFALETAVAELLENFAGLEDDFAEFFPLLQSHLENVTEAERSAPSKRHAEETAVVDQA